MSEEILNIAARSEYAAEKERGLDRPGLVGMYSLLFVYTVHAFGPRGVDGKA